MAEKPILFSGPMVNAILAGRKTQTRRITIPANLAETDTLWVRESVRLYDRWCDGKDDHAVAHYMADDETVMWLDSWPWKRDVLPSIHMPKGLCRLFLRVTDVRQEWLQDITEDDAKAEGAYFTDYGQDCYHGGGPIKDASECPLDKYHLQRPGWSMVPTESDGQCLHSARFAFANFWDKLNAKRGYSWESNPQVWVIEFQAQFSEDSARD